MDGTVAGYSQSASDARTGYNQASATQPAMGPLTDCEITAKELRDRVATIAERLACLANALVGSQPEKDTASAGQSLPNGRLADLRITLGHIGYRFNDIEGVISRLETAIN